MLSVLQLKEPDEWQAMINTIFPLHLAKSKALHCRKDKERNLRFNALPLPLICKL